MLPLFGYFPDLRGLKSRSEACRISHSHASVQWLPQAAQPFILGMKSYGSFQRAPVAPVKGGLVNGGALGPTPEAKLTMDVAFGPGDPCVQFQRELVVLRLQVLQVTPCAKVEYSLTLAQSLTTLQCGHSSGKNCAFKSLPSPLSP